MAGEIVYFSTRSENTHRFVAKLDTPARRIPIIVADVHQFPGHIACDSASNSEIVIPLLRRGELLGVLDIDSPQLSRFDAADQAGLEKFVEALLNAI